MPAETYVPPGWVLTGADSVRNRLSRCDCEDCTSAYSAEEIAWYRVRRGVGADGQVPVTLSDMNASWGMAYTSALYTETERRNQIDARRREGEVRREAERLQREEDRQRLEEERRAAQDQREREWVERQRHSCGICGAFREGQRITARGPYRACDNCLPQLVACAGCNMPILTHDMIELPRYGYRRCRGCINIDFNRCTGCSAYFDYAVDTQCCPVVITDFDDDDDDSPRCSDNDYCDGQHYEDEDHNDYRAERRQRDSDSNLIHSYSYTPRPLTFHGTDPNRVFLGVELELAMKRDRYDMARDAYNEFGESRIYVKEDSSISYGWELVTYPMSFDYHMHEMPWHDALTRLAEIGIAGDESTGMHVHVSKRGFSGPDHDHRWLMFWHRNAVPLTVMARRNPQQWGSFDDYTRKNAVRIAKKQLTNNMRYAAVNSVPPRTYEIRVFAASVNPAEVMGSIALVAATVEYTRSLRASDILRRKGWEWDTFIAWLALPANERFAPALSEWERLRPVPVAPKPRRRRTATVTEDAPTLRYIEYDDTAEVMHILTGDGTAIDDFDFGNDSSFTHPDVF